MEPALPLYIHPHATAGISRPCLGSLVLQALALPAGGQGDGLWSNFCHPPSVVCDVLILLL